ncbi:MutS family DNA mismatch repair protein [Candidatus Saganbacteria bacterium]|nr:MutS family DNA mismatch repair protein [Candidatus Saganbacteria bacterium]
MVSSIRCSERTQVGRPGPSRQVTHPQLLPKTAPADEITAKILPEMQAWSTHSGLALDTSTLADLEIFSGYGSRTLFDMLDFTRTAYGQARLWHLLEKPLRDPREIRERQEAVKTLQEDPALRSLIQGKLSEIYNQKVYLRQADGFAYFIPRLSIIEQFLREREKPFFQYGRSNLSTLAIHLPIHLAGGAIPLAFIVAAFYTIMNNPQAIQAANDHKLTVYESGLVASVCVTTLLYLTQYLPEFRAKMSMVKASTRELRRLFILADELNQQLRKTGSNKLHEMASIFGNIKSGKTKGFVERAEKYGRSFWHRTIPLDHAFIQGGHRRMVTDLMFNLGDLDCLCSQAEAAEKYGFAFPQVEEQSAPLLIARGLWHPFLDKPVVNDLELDDQARFMVLSGSNMSGKSTILKAAALAIILGQMGGGVPAQTMRFTPFDQLITNVNIVDNLSAGKSLYYSEKDRMQQITEASKSGDKVFAAMDEIFRGTNHPEAVATAIAISSFIADQPNARSILATHLEEVPLWVEETTPPFVTNHHMAATIESGKLRFGYKIAEGRSILRGAVQILEECQFDPLIISLAHEILKKLMDQPTPDWT